VKKLGILNRDIATALASLGHTDTIIIADCGLPIPKEIDCIDLSINLGTPSLMAVIKAVMDDMTVEKFTLANEIKHNNAYIYTELIKKNPEMPIDYISHEELKQKIKQAKTVIRTGEATPYANIILHAGVIF
jgi:D-ribose pyranase